MSKNCAKRRRQRERLFLEQNGLCYWCKQPMRLIQTDGHTKYFPPDMCTIEHLDSRWSPTRHPHHKESRHVVACRKCNNDRDHEEKKLLPQEIKYLTGKGMKAPDAIKLLLAKQESESTT